MLNHYALRQTLEAAAAAHHEYQTVALDRVHDEQWAAFYAAYALGRLGDFMAPSALKAQLEAVEPRDNWSEAAAEAIVSAL